MYLSGLDLSSLPIANNTSKNAIIIIINFFIIFFLVKIDNLLKTQDAYIEFLSKSIDISSIC